MRRIKLTMAGLVLATTSMMAQQAPLNQPVYKIPVKVHVLNVQQSIASAQEATNLRNQEYTGAINANRNNEIFLSEGNGVTRAYKCPSLRNQVQWSGVSQRVAPEGGASIIQYRNGDETALTTAEIAAFKGGNLWCLDNRVYYRAFTNTLSLTDLGSANFDNMRNNISQYISWDNINSGITTLNNQLRDANANSRLNIELCLISDENNYIEDNQSFEEGYAYYPDRYLKTLKKFKGNDNPQTQVLHMYIVPYVSLENNGNAISYIPGFDENGSNGGVIMTAAYWPTRTEVTRIEDSNNIAYGVGHRGGLAHELGHYFGLKHTFQNGCDAVNDGIHDTPRHTGNSGTNLCEGEVAGDLANNFMTYSTTQTQFTNGQVAKITEILEGEHRRGLWQIPNLITRGIIKSKNQTASARAFVSASLSRFNTTTGTDTNTELNNVARADRYTNNTANSIAVTPGKYQFKATLAARPAGNNSNSRVALWLDFNGNLNADAGEVFHSQEIGAGTQLNFEVNVPKSMAKDRDIFARLILTQREAQLTSPEITAHSQPSDVAVADFAANVIDYKFNYSPNNAAELRNQYIVADFKESINRVAGANNTVHTNASKLKYNDFSTGTIQLTRANNTLAIRVDKNQSIRDGQQSYVVAWVDWNENNTFDAAERQHASIAIDSVSTNLNITIPDTAKLGKTYKLLVGSGLSTANPVVGNNILDFDPNTQRNLYSLKLAEGYCPSTSGLLDNNDNRINQISFRTNRSVAANIINIDNPNLNYQSLAERRADGTNNYTVNLDRTKKQHVFGRSVALTNNLYSFADLWIDYNQNGVFEDTEKRLLFEPKAYNQEFSTAADTPMDLSKIELGKYKARLKTYMNRYYRSYSNNPCTSDVSFRGQAVDFTINITDSFCTPIVSSRDASYNLLSNRISSVRVGNTTIAANETAVQFAEKVVADNSEKAYNDYSAKAMLPLFTGTNGNELTINAASNTADARAQVFVDWNNNGAFEATETVQSSVFANNAATVILVAPAAGVVTNVPLRMRVVTNSNLSCPAENAQAYINDYLVRVTPPQAPVVAQRVGAGRVGAQEEVTTQWQVSPVPSQGDLRLDSPAKTKAKIYNTLGQQVETLDLEQGENKLNLGHLGAGVYYILDDQMMFKTLKFIINK